ncbi:hypothetical protein BLNAU_5792 [Blattamonas nauphoetae]|uniref:Uncharacterized protein n=1 Tax=Blattamonas nauphoetae TaxID=2049346 RepID=A0ABQ9Y6A4_9EUKA|nr:hypothetical protein BLNAU_5792 [Blattamonas nauphoetae]
MGCTSSSNVGSAPAIMIPDGESKQILCYKCGKAIPYSEYEAHESENCFDAFTKITRTLPVSEAKKLPQKLAEAFPKEDAEAAVFNAYNQAAAKTASVMSAKCYCGQSFLPSQFTEHVKTCEKYQENDSAVKIQSALQGIVQKKQYGRIVICYMCGEGFPVEKLADHQEPNNCSKRQQEIRDSLPEQLKGTVPEKPEAEVPAADGEKEAFNAYNKEAQECYRKSLPVCKCGKRLVLNTVKNHMEKCDLWKQ